MFSLAQILRLFSLAQILRLFSLAQILRLQTQIFHEERNFFASEVVSCIFFAFKV